MVSRYGRRKTLSRGQPSRKLLIDEPPLQVLPSLAVSIGLTEAIVLQQVHYWLGRSDHVHDGRRWIYRTHKGWKREIPWWSVATIKRALASLQARGLLIKGNSNDRGFDRTSWWTIDYEMMARLEAAIRAPMTGSASTNGAAQDAPVAGSASADGAARDAPTERLTPHQPIPETTSESPQRREGPSLRLLQLWEATLDEARLPQGPAGDVHTLRPVSWAEGRLVLWAPTATMAGRWEKRAPELVRLLAAAAPVALRELTVMTG